jgi:hypothetical protein
MQVQELLAETSTASKARLAFVRNHRGKRLVVDSIDNCGLWIHNL